MEGRIECFAPVFAPDARLLILGTMPSVESLKQSFYYSHPRNAFWPIMAQVLGEELPDTAQGKREMLLRHKIALWDVARSCIRPGSLDSDIRDAAGNDIPELYRNCPEIGKILFNGATAMKLYKRLIGGVPEGIAWAQTPSTSPAYTLKFERKLAAWRDAMEGFYV